MADEIYNWFQKELRMAFLGFVPAHFKAITRKEVKEVSNLVKDKLADNKPINHIELLQGAGLILAPNFSKSIKRKSSEKLLQEVIERQSNGSLVVKSVYYKAIKNKTPVEERIKIGAFLVHLLIEFRKVYGFNLLNEQDAFIYDIKRNNSIFQLCTDIAYSVPESAFKPRKIEVSEIWPGSKDQLGQMAEGLLASKFVDADTLFAQVFLKDFTSTCNWGESSTSFMYLMNRIFKESQNDRLMVLCEFYSQKFTFKKEKKDARFLRETLRNIKNITEYEHRFLSGHYLKLYELHASIFPK
jgi:hypothetical protein